MCDQLAQLLLGGVGLAVLAVVFLRVLGRGLARVERDGDFGLVFVVEIDKRRGTVALLQRIEVGIDEVAVNFPLFPVGAVGQLLLLQAELARDAVGGVGEDLEQVGAAVAHPLDAVPLGIEVVQQVAVGVICTGEHHAAVLVDIHEGEVDRLLAGIDDAGGGAGVVFGHVDDPRRKEAQAVEVVGSHLGDNAVVAVKDVVGDLAADDGGDALDGGEECLGQRGVLAGAQPLLDLLGGEFDEVELILRWRQSVVHAGEDGAHRGHGVVDAFDRVDDPAVLVDEDDVGVTAHDLDGQRQLNQVDHLVAGFKDQVQDAVQPDLPQRNELGAAQVLA